MSSEEPPEAAGASASAGPSGQPSEEELRAAYEAELARVTSTDMIAQAAVSLLNIGALRLGPAGAPPGAQAQSAATTDLEQARDAIDAARALLEILERRIPGELRSLRDALAQLQMVYARAVQSAGPAAAAQEPAGGAAAEKGAGQQQGEQKPHGDGGKQGGEGGEGPGPAQSSGRLWVPGS